MPHSRGPMDSTLSLGYTRYRHDQTYSYMVDGCLHSEQLLKEDSPSGVVSTFTPTREQREDHKQLVNVVAHNYVSEHCELSSKKSLLS